MFVDRRQAGRILAQAVPDLKGSDSLVVALPRGGLPVAREIALAFGLPLDIVLVRKVGVPGHPELALGAVSDGHEMTLTVNQDIVDQLGMDADTVEMLARKVLPELERRQRLYLRGHPPLDVRGRTVVVVDDGAATGATLRAALHVLKERGAGRLIVALPVAPAEVVEDIRKLADEVVCLECPSPFLAVGAHYAVFDQTSDQEVTAILDDLRDQDPGAGS